MSNTLDVERVLSKIDRRELTNRVVEMVQIMSPTGSESDMSLYLENKYVGLGLKVVTQEVEEGRTNVIGILRGTGNGPTLQFDGHLDVSFTGKESWMRGAATASLGKVDLVQGQEWIFGAGSFNMKASLAAYMAAVKAIKESDVKLKGDIMLTATVGEIEETQVDDFRGKSYRGYGYGAGYAASHGVVSDFAILGEPTGLRLMIGHFGSFWAKITAAGGTVIHTAWSKDVPNKIEQSSKVIQRLTEWKEEFQQKAAYKGYKGIVNIAAISGGKPWKSSRTPDSVSIYLDIRFPPTMTPLHVKAQLEQLVYELNHDDPALQLELEPYCTNPATEIEEDAYIVKSIKQSHKKVLGAEPEMMYELWYSNAPHFNAMGSKAVNYGPSGGRKIQGLTLSDRDREYISVQDLYDITKVYTLVAMDICTKTRAEVRPDLK
jgi:acetylornithine deacetylase/succinyl-diaminopimelate desuccinylase-like protein